MSISVSSEVEESIREAAAASGMSISAWLAKVATHAAKVEAGLTAMRHLEAEQGPVSVEDRQHAEEILLRAMRSALRYEAEQ